MRSLVLSLPIPMDVCGQDSSFVEASFSAAGECRLPSKRPVEVGDQDRDYVEITKGLSVGEVYAADNSFVVKAEIGKSEAEHE